MGIDKIKQHPIATSMIALTVLSTAVAHSKAEKDFSPTDLDATHQNTTISAANWTQACIENGPQNSQEWIDECIANKPTS